MPIYSKGRGRPARMPNKKRGGTIPFLKGRVCNFRCSQELLDQVEKLTDDRSEFIIEAIVEKIRNHWKTDYIQDAEILEKML